MMISELFEIAIGMFIVHEERFLVMCWMLKHM
jgi:hypothetical protein